MGDGRASRLAAAVFLLQTAGSGTAVYALPIYIAALHLSDRVSAGEISVASAAYFVASASSGLLYGRIRARRAVPGLAVSVVVGAAAIASLAVVANGPSAIVVFAALGLSFNGLVVVGTALLVAVYDGRPSAGMALATAGSSAGGILVSPLLAALLARGLDPAALIAVAGCYLVVCGVGVAVIGRTRRRAGEPPEPTGVPGTVATGIMRHWALLIALSLVTASQLAAMSYSVAVGISGGLPGAEFSVAVITAAAVASRWIGSVGIRRLGLRRWTLITFLAQAAGVLLVGRASSTWMLYVGGLLVGQSLGNTLLVRSQVVVDLFGIPSFPRRFGQVMTFTSLGSAIGPYLLGQVVAITGNYADAYLATFGLNLLGAPFLIPWLRSGRARRVAPTVSGPPVSGSPTSALLEECP